MKSAMTIIASIVICSPIWALAASPQIPIRVTNEMIYQKILDIEKRQTVMEIQLSALKESTDKRFEDINMRFEDINMRFEDINRRFEDINMRFEDINRRFEDINTRFEDINMRFEDMNKRFEDINKRFEEIRIDMNKRFEQLFTFLWIITGIFTSIMISVLGLIYWDRRTIIKQARHETIAYLESEGKIRLIIEVLKKRSEKDAELATILRQFNIL